MEAEDIGSADLAKKTKSISYDNRTVIEWWCC